ncbi:rhomboid family intramembrane serine protease [uncultured Tateyamaria sp.]|uniref:rhomboid family intramembrane serine protease n=1 Tax=uncultured Tateyamaria sp. TaxID=455651 RepID=UPI002606CA11|nr:rhomboid family intramembrane serine protease [uncultured Tateyamaria sp.]
MSDHREPSPVNPLPPAVWLLFLALALPELIFSAGEAGLAGGAGAVGWRLNALNTFSFSGDAFDFMVENARLLPEHMMRFVTYPFVFGSFTSSLFAGVILLAMGKMVGEVLGGWAVVLMFFLSGIFGALVFGLVTNEPWLVGAYPCVYGLIGTYTFLYWQRQVATGGPQSQAFMLIGVLMGIQLLFGVLFQTGLGWIGELSGFVAGFALTAFVVPGGMARVMAVLRRR